MVAAFRQAVETAPEQLVAGHHKQTHQADAEGNAGPVALARGVGDIGAQPIGLEGGATPAHHLGHDAGVPGAAAGGDTAGDPGGEDAGQDQLAPALQAVEPHVIGHLPQV